MKPRGPVSAIQPQSGGVPLGTLTVGTTGGAPEKVNGKSPSKFRAGGSWPKSAAPAQIMETQTYSKLKTRP